MKRINDLFDVIYGVNLEYYKMEEDKAGIPFIARGSKNNGCVGFVKKIEGIEPNPANTISVSASGSVLECFLQKEKYYSGRDLVYLMPRKEITDEQMLYYCMALRANKYRYSYGRQANKTLREIKIPSLEEIPKNLISINSINKPTNKPVLIKKLNLKDREWKWFNYWGDNGLFNVSGTKTTPLDELEEYGKGRYPYVTTQSANNGVRYFYDHYTEDGNVFVADSAVAGYCSYQFKDFSASDHVEKLELKTKLNPYIAMFIVTLINLEQYRYNYGRKCSQTKLKESKIKLPVDNEGKPDWEFMEYYIKSLPYSNNLENINERLY